MAALSATSKTEITSAVFSAAAILATLYRLYTRRNKLWLDDGLAMFSLTVLVAQVIAVFLPVTGRDTGIIRYYIIAASFYTTVWSARLSMLFSIIRIDPFTFRRKVMLAIGIFFFVVYIALLSQLIWLCEANPSWKNMQIPMCHLQISIGIGQLVADTTIDFILLIAPLQLFFILRDKWLRNRLIIIFSTCIVTTIVSLVHIIYIFRSAGLKVLISGIVENCVALFICNVPVVVTGFCQLGEQTSRNMDPVLPSFMIVTHPRSIADSSGEQTRVIQLSNTTFKTPSTNECSTPVVAVSNSSHDEEL